MKPHIDGTAYGVIQVDGIMYNFDIAVDTEGFVWKRKIQAETHSKKEAHCISLPEILEIMKDQADYVVIGTGFDNCATLNPAAKEYLVRMEIGFVEIPTRKAISVFNNAKGAVAGLFHLGC